MRSVLVTGASGFLGAEVMQRLLKRGHKATGLDPLAAPGATGRHAIDDLSDRKRLFELFKDEKITHVVHCGGVSGPMVLAHDPAKVMDINVAGSLNLLQASLQCDVKTFVYCSSVSAVGDFYEDEPIGDDYPLKPMSPYGCSKAAMDMVLRGLWRRVSVDLCSLRFTTIYGPGRQTSLAIDDIVAAAIRGGPVEVEPATDWSYVYIDDAADAVIAACFSERRNQLCYFIAYPEQVPLQAIAAATAIDGIKPPSLVVKQGRATAKRGPLGIAPAQRDFNFVPQVDHREGIRRMIDALRTQPT